MALLPKGYNNKFIRTIEQTICEYDMLQPGDPVLVGVSGGPDSVALLHILHRLAPTFHLKLAVAHFDHALRQPESERDAKFVASLAETLALPLFLETGDVHQYRKTKHLSLEEAARDLRYAFYLSTARQRGFKKIATAHHADDNAELILLFLLRGSGVTGMTGIPPIRDFGPNGIKIIRPFIHMAKSDILAYLNERQLIYVSDKTNLDLKHMRNRIRHQLLPLLKDQFNPRVVDALRRFATIMGSEKKWIEDSMQSLCDELLVSDSPDLIRIMVNKLVRLDPAVQRRIVRRAIEKIKGDLRRITFGHIESVRRLLDNPRSQKCLHLPAGIRIRQHDDELIFTLGSPRVSANAEFEYKIARTGKVHIRKLDVHMRLSEIPGDAFFDFHHAGQNVAFFDMDSLAFPLILRNFKPGDRFQPLGMDGSQKVKTFFINRKVPRAERFDYPILECQGKIIWVVGQRIAETAKITAATQRILKCEYNLPPQQ